MHGETFKSLHENLERNIDEIEATIKRPNLLTAPDVTNNIERLKYLFYSVTKALIDVGNNIIFDKDFREPINPADIFISLAERDIIVPALVPRLKRAVMALPKLNDFTQEDVLNVISETIDDIHKCLGYLAVHFNIEDKKT